MMGRRTTLRAAPEFAGLLVGDDGGEARAIHLVDEGGLARWLATRTERDRSACAAALFQGSPGQMVILPGEAADDSWEAAAGVRHADRLGAWDLAPVAARLPEGSYRLAGGEPLGAAGLGWLLSHYAFDAYRSATEPARRRRLLARDGSEIASTVRMAEATSLLRDLINTPASDLGPSELAEIVAEQATRFGAEAHVIRGEELLAAGYPAIHAVGRAASRAPCLADLRWGDPTSPRLTIVGKGVCFDSGGLNLKTTPGLLNMKGDMGGAAHAIALARLVMQADLPVRLRLLVPAVENAVSGDAYRPGDVITTRKGVTVEVGNTDAEGRLILADALAAAQEDEPDLIVDFATLTAAARAALGPEVTPFFTNCDRLAADLHAAGGATEDPVWRLPLWRPYRELLRSDVADMINVGDPMLAGSIVAALFLETFVEPPTQWLHLDICGWSRSERPGRPKGGEATGLRAVWGLVSERLAGGA